MALERSLRAEGKQVRWLVAGQEGSLDAPLSAATRSTRPGRASATGPSYADAQAIAHRLAELYSEQEIDRAVVVYNHFESALVQRVIEQDVLPIPEEMLEAGEEEDEESQALRRRLHLRARARGDPERLLPVYLETEIYRALLESAASEQGARMTAMRNASKNAGELIDNV